MSDDLFSSHYPVYPDKKEFNEMIPYAVVVRECDVGDGWQWEAKIEEVGLLAYGATKEAAFKSIMEKYKSLVK